MLIPVDANSSFPSGATGIPTNHCGRNTHFRQIYFGVPNFNFKNIYMKFE